MKKRTIVVLVLIVVIGCGSIAVLPHFLFRYGMKNIVPTSFVKESFISHAWFDLLDPLTVNVRGCVFVLPDNFFLHCKKLSIKLELRELLRASKPFTLRFDEMYVVADGSPLPIGDITVRIAHVYGHYRSPGLIEVETAHGEGEFGQFNCVGFIDPQKIHLDCRFDISSEYMLKIPFVPHEDIDPAQEFYTISALLDGTYAELSLTASSELFNFSIQINE